MTVHRRSFLIGAAALMVTPPRIPAPAIGGETFAAVRMIATDIAMLPMTNYERVTPVGCTKEDAQWILRAFGIPKKKWHLIDARFTPAAPPPL